MSKKAKFFVYIFLIIFGIFMLAPFVWMISTSFKEPGAVFSTPTKWIPIPKKIYNRYFKVPENTEKASKMSDTSISFRKFANKLGVFPAILDNYIKTWTSVPFGRFFINSIVVALLVTFGQVFTSSLAAYSFARLRYPGRDTLFFLYLATIMVPMQVVIIPNFIVVTKLGWIDTYNALILPVMFSAYGTFMLRQFFLGIPRDLEDAALIDGCSRFRIYWNIILPLSKPALATLATFTFMTNWNSFFWPLVVTSSMEMKTLPVGLAAFQGKYNTDWTMLMAAAVITLLPVVIVYLFNQRFITKGIALTGIKA